MSNKLVTALATVMVLLCLNYAASASVLDFEGLTTASSDKMPVNYGGFTWHTMYLLSDTFYTGAPWNNTYGSPSGVYATYNQGKDSEIISNIEFDFTGAYFTGWAKNDELDVSTAPSLIIYGYNGSTLMNTLNFDLSTDKYDWIQADFLGVTKLTFSAPGYPNYWLMDNFTYNESNPVPVPATIYLLGAGLFCLQGLRKKIKK